MIPRFLVGEHSCPQAAAASGTEAVELERRHAAQTAEHALLGGVFWSCYEESMGIRNPDLNDGKSMGFHSWFFMELDSDEIWMGYILGPSRFTCWMFLVNSEDGDTRRHYSYSYGLLFFHDGLFGWRYRCSEPSWFLICQWLTWVTAGWGEPSFFSWCCQLLYAHFFEFYLFLEVPNHDGWKFKLSWVLSHVSAASSYFFSSDSQLRQKRWDSVTEALLEHAKVRHARVVWAGRWIVNAQEIPPR